MSPPPKHLLLFSASIFPNHMFSTYNCSKQSDNCPTTFPEHMFRLRLSILIFPNNIRRSYFAQQYLSILFDSQQHFAMCFPTISIDLSFNYICLILIFQTTNQIFISPSIISIIKQDQLTFPATCFQTTLNGNAMTLDFPLCGGGVLLILISV